MIILDVIFKILNFALFVTVLGYYFKTRILTNLRTQITTKNATQKAALVAIAQEEESLRDLNTRVIDQDALYKKLQEKLHVWHESLKHRNEQLVLEHRRREEAMCKMMLLRERNKEICSEARRIFPIVMHETSAELEHIFSDARAQRNYNHKVLTALENRARLSGSGL